MIRLLCLLGFISLFIGCPATGGNGSSDNAATDRAVPTDSPGKR